jgi:hypothetical protein
MHGILVALPSGIMFGLFQAVKQFHVYCLIFSRNVLWGQKRPKNRQKPQFSRVRRGRPPGNLSNFIKI